MQNYAEQFLGCDFDIVTYYQNVDNSNFLIAPCVGRRVHTGNTSIIHERSISGHSLGVNKTATLQNLKTASGVSIEMLIPNSFLNVSTGINQKEQNSAEKQEERLVLTFVRQDVFRCQFSPDSRTSLTNQANLHGFIKSLKIDVGYQIHINIQISNQKEQNKRNVQGTGTLDFLPDLLKLCSANTEKLEEKLNGRTIQAITLSYKGIGYELPHIAISHSNLESAFEQISVVDRHYCEKLSHRSLTGSICIDPLDDIQQYDYKMPLLSLTIPTPEVSNSSSHTFEDMIEEINKKYERWQFTNLIRFVNEKPYQTVDGLIYYYFMQSQLHYTIGDVSANTSLRRTETLNNALTDDEIDSFILQIRQNRRIHLALSLNGLPDFLRKIKDAPLDIFKESNDAQKSVILIDYMDMYGSNNHDVFLDGATRYLRCTDFFKGYLRQVDTIDAIKFELMLGKQRPYAIVITVHEQLFNGDAEEFIELIMKIRRLLSWSFEQEFSKILFVVNEQNRLKKKILAIRSRLERRLSTMMPWWQFLFSSSEQQKEQAYEIDKINMTLEILTLFEKNSNNWIVASRHTKQIVAERISNPENLFSRGCYYTPFYYDKNHVKKTLLFIASCFLELKRIQQDYEKDIRDQQAELTAMLKELNNGQEQYHAALAGKIAHANTKIDALIAEAEAMRTKIRDLESDDTPVLGETITVPMSKRGLWSIDAIAEKYLFKYTLKTPYLSVEEVSPEKEENEWQSAWLPIEKKGRFIAIEGREANEKNKSDGVYESYYLPAYYDHDDTNSSQTNVKVMIATKHTPSTYARISSNKKELKIIESKLQKERVQKHGLEAEYRGRFQDIHLVNKYMSKRREYRILVTKKDCLNKDLHELHSFCWKIGRISNLCLTGTEIPLERAILDEYISYFRNDTPNQLQGDLVSSAVWAFPDGSPENQLTTISYERNRQRLIQSSLILLGLCGGLQYFLSKYFIFADDIAVNYFSAVNKALATIGLGFLSIAFLAPVSAQKKLLEKFPIITVGLFAIATTTTLAINTYTNMEDARSRFSGSTFRY